MKLQPDDGQISSLGIGPGSDDAVGPRREFAKRFAEGIGKVTGNTPGDRQKKTGRPTARISKAARLAGVNLAAPTWVAYPPSTTQKLGTGDSTVDLGGSATNSHWQPLCFQGTGDPTVAHQ
ncbi:hypothetical protein BHE74_00032730 [Ensete ventricosum]|nr:hypothetical protein BHE74_00032730 [Ensete ventricosum]